MLATEERPSPEDRASFIEAVAGALDGVWPAATSAETNSVVDATAALAELGVFDLGGMGAVEFLIDICGELGARSLAAPIADAFIATLLCPEHVASIESRDMRVVAHIGSFDSVVIAFGAQDATHVLSIDPHGSGVRLGEVTAATPIAALHAVGGQTLTLGDSVTITASTEQQEQAVALLLLAQAARIAGSGREGHELATEHAKTRHQFGRAIGAFGAVQQRVATCQINVSANTALIDEAVNSFAVGGKAAIISAHLAARHVADTAVQVVSGSQHTLGAIGYFDEHDMAWLFRSVHADISLFQARLNALPEASRLASRLVHGEEKLPHFELGEAAETLRQSVRALLERNKTADGFDTEAVRQDAEAEGLFSLSWPVEEGGLAASLEEQVALNEEMKYAGGPVDRAMSATMLIGHALLRHGTEAQRAAFLPLLRAGKMNFCLGYSEPEAGSDLASLRTSAVQDGDEWVINGQKMWTTRAQTASHVWLAVRTDPDAKPRHAGITIFLVPMDTPGITIQQHVALSGEISCTVYYDQVRVPDSTRVGEVNGGWKVITDALAAERVVMGGIASTLLGHFDALLEWTRAHPDALTPVHMDRIAWVASRLQAARALVLAATRAMSGDQARIIGPVAGVLSGDLAEEFARVAMDIVGLNAFDGSDDTRRFEELLRLAPMYVIGGGTNDIQRGIIARSLGLPRE